MNRLIVRYGIYSGVISSVLMLLTAFQIRRYGVLENGEIYGFAGMILSMVFVFVGVRVFREQERNGQISFGEAFKVGGLIALISCVFYVITWMFVSEYITPDFMDKYIAHYLENMKNKGLSEADIQEASAKMAQYKTMYANPLYRMGLTFIEPLPVALPMTFLSALILRKKG